MKTLQTIIAVTIISLFTVSCSDDGDSDTNKPVVLLEKETYDSGSSVNYTYDADNKLIAEEYIDPGSHSTKKAFSYNSNGKIEEYMWKKTGGNPSPPEKTIYIYDAQNRLVERKFFKASEKKPSSYDYISSVFFEYNGNLVTVKQQTKGNNLPNFRKIFDFDNKGNIVKETTYNEISLDNPNGFLSNVKTITYDDKWHPHTSLPAEYNFPYSTTNNPLKETLVLFGSEEPHIQEFVYEYNADGYVINSKGTNQIPITYEYKK